MPDRNLQPLGSLLDGELLMRHLSDLREVSHMFRNLGVTELTLNLNLHNKQSEFLTEPQGEASASLHAIPLTEPRFEFFTLSLS